MPGPRPSHYRLLDFTPAGGIRLSELARRANITKQALGEFVTALARVGADRWNVFCQVLDALADPP